MKKITFALLCLSTQLMFGQTPVGFYPTSPASGLQFGSKVASFNNNVLVASNSFAPMSQTGKTYLFDLDGSNLVQTNVFYPSDALISDSFGKSISLNDEFIAIGSPFHDANFENSGAVYIYRKVAGNWTFIQKIMASDATLNSQFGTFVKIHNNQLFISSINYQNANQDPNSNFGKVYVYFFSGTEWTQSQTLATTETFKFGEKIEFENNKLVVLSRQNTDQFSARFHTYNFDGTTWSFQNSTQTFGSIQDKITDYSLSGNQLFITSNGMSGNKVSIYDVTNGNWNFTNSINQTQFSDQVFTRLEVENDNMFIGSSEYILQIERKFPLIHYKKIDGSWVYQNAFYGNGPSANDDYFGSELALSGNKLIIGAPQEGAVMNFGKTYFLDTTLGIEEFSTSKTIVYPNPTKDLIYFHNNFEDINSVDIYSITGKLLLTKNGNSNQLSLRDLASGIYFLRVNFSKNLTQTIKIIKE